MSQTLLIVKKDEWSQRRNWTPTTTESNNTVVDLSTPTLERRHNNTMQPLPNDIVGATEDRRRTTTAFQPLVKEEETGTELSSCLSPSDSEDTDRASPTSIVSSSQPAWIVPSPTSSDVGDERRIRDLEEALAASRAETARLQDVAEAAQTLRTKTLGNLKKKRAELAHAEEEKERFRRELEEAAALKVAAAEENASLKLGLQKLAVTKDTIKAKLKTKDELHKESLKENLRLHQQLQQMERVHTLERELLEHYRKLARHTGYYRWGKPIRNLETQLAERGALESEAVASGP